MVAGIDVQFVVSGCSYPFCWHADELEDEGLDAAKNGVRGADAEGGMEREMGHQVVCHVFDAVTATEVYAHQRACYFAVLVAESGTTKPQLAVDNWADITVKLLHHVKNSTERGDFLRFYDYLCHVIDDFACFELQH